MRHSSVLATMATRWVEVFGTDDGEALELVLSLFAHPYDHEISLYVLNN